MPVYIVKYEVELPKIVIIIFGFIAFGLCANAFRPVFNAKEVLALGLLGSVLKPIHIVCDSGCK